MDWPTWIEQQKPGIAAICRGEPDPLPTVRPLKEIIEAGEALPRITAKRCIDVAAQLSGLKPQDLTGPRRAKEFVRARDLAVKLMVDCCSHMSLPQIGRVLHRNHTTVMAARDRAEKRMDEHPEYDALYKRARAAL